MEMNWAESSPEALRRTALRVLEACRLRLGERHPGCQSRRSEYDKAQRSNAGLVICGEVYMVSTHSSGHGIIVPQANVFGDVTVNIDGGVVLLLIYVVVALGAALLESF